MNKVSNKLSQRSKRYMFFKRVTKMMVTTLSKQIQVAIDEQIIEMLKEIAKEEVDEIKTY